MDKHMDHQMRRAAFERLQNGMNPELTQLWHQARVQMGLGAALILLDETLRFAHRLETKEINVREINYGPVSNPDGTPTEMTKQMLEGTGRSLTPPFDFKEDEDLESQFEDRHLEQPE